ncbi:VOC family protein [Lachnospiraceae bacterium NSJ-143]|nr:VOC family protein [Lachnospiraceae bacterium NSJ-143]
MKLKNMLLVVEDMERSKQFYKEALGLRVIMDFGSNITLTGGLSLQTKESWLNFIGVSKDYVEFGGRDCEVYFEEDNFDEFIEKLSGLKNIEYVHKAVEHSWGQRAVRFYDPDLHIIEVGENIKAVCRRFIESGMTDEEVSKRMDVPVKFVNACKR